MPDLSIAENGQTIVARVNVCWVRPNWSGLVMVRLLKLAGNSSTLSAYDCMLYILFDSLK